jgi:hypothetical protein
MELLETRRISPTPVTPGKRAHSTLARLVLIGAACAFTCACGGGGGSGGADDPPAVPPPAQKAELGWDDGNWDQKDWQ